MTTINMTANDCYNYHYFFHNPPNYFLETNEIINFCWYYLLFLLNFILQATLSTIPDHGMKKGLRSPSNLTLPVIQCSKVHHSGYQY